MTCARWGSDTALAKRSPQFGVDDAANAKCCAARRLYAESRATAQAEPLAKEAGG